jgi:hypothetical protein
MEDNFSLDIMPCGQVVMDVFGETVCFTSTGEQDNSEGTCPEVWFLQSNSVVLSFTRHCLWSANSRPVGKMFFSFPETYIWSHCSEQHGIGPCHGPDTVGLYNHALFPLEIHVNILLLYVYNV